MIKLLLHTLRALASPSLTGPANARQGAGHAMRDDTHRGGARGMWTAAAATQA